MITSDGKVNFNVHMTETVYSCQGGCQASQAGGVRVVFGVRSFLERSTCRNEILSIKRKHVLRFSVGSHM